MNVEDPAPDRDISEMLRRLDQAHATPAHTLDSLARRITNAAEPVLAQRRGHTAWWMFAADWARSLIPIGATAVLVAAALLLWATRTPVAARPASASADSLTQSLLYSLVAPVEEHVIEPRRARR